MNLRLLLPLAAGLGVAVNALPTARAQQTVTIDVDVTGVPHVRAPSDRGAFYGAGYSAARDRLFQMCWSRLRYLGRTAEFFGAGPNGEHEQHDIIARTLGWRRIAARLVASLPADQRRLLQFYANGVNEYAASSGAVIHPLFATTGAPRPPVMPWTAEDCLGTWFAFMHEFQGVGLGEAASRRVVDSMPTATPQQVAEALFRDAYCDDDVAVVGQSDVPTSLQAAMLAFKTTYGVEPDLSCTLGTYVPAFSEALVVAGSKTDTGRAILVGLPRVPVYSPNAFHEVHFVGGTFDVRGMTLPGCPFVIAGSTPYHAWSPTKLGHDMTDLFKLQIDPIGHPDQFLLDGTWRNWRVAETETVLVKTGPGQSTSVPVRYRECYWGPVVSSLLGPSFAGEEYALKGVPFTTTDKCDLSGFLGMYRATGIQAFYAATEGWTYPSTNLVFGSSSGSIGYTITGLLPVRKANQWLPGVFALDGNTTANDWQTTVPHDLRPHVIDPANGWLFSANHLPIGSWYPLKSLIGGSGEGQRARVIREFLTSQSTFTEADLANVMRSSLNTFMRDITFLGSKLKHSQGYPLSTHADAALQILEPWLAAGAKLEATHYGVAVAHYLPATVQPGLVPGNEDVNVLQTYGGNTAGMNLFLREAKRGLTLTPSRPLNNDEAAVIDALLVAGLAGFQAAAPAVASGPTSGWITWYRDTFLTNPAFPRWTTLGSDGPLDQSTVYVGPLISTRGGTLLEQYGAAYNQIVDIGRTDGARSMLAFGQSEHDGSVHGFDQQVLWETATLKSSPTSPAGVSAYGISVTIALTVP